MTYGFQSINDSSFVQIDAEAPRLCVLTRGSYSGVSNASGVFARAVTSQDPPIVFIRPDQGGPVQVPISVCAFGMEAPHLFTTAGRPRWWLLSLPVTGPTSAARYSKRRLSCLLPSHLSC